MSENQKQVYLAPKLEQTNNFVLVTGVSLPVQLNNVLSDAKEKAK